MSPGAKFARMGPVLLIALAGCSDLAGWPTKQSPRRVVAKPQPAPPTIASSQSAEGETHPGDPHREETIDQVLAFVDRLGQTAEPEANSDAQEQATAAPESGSDRGLQSPRPGPGDWSAARVNRPLDVNVASDQVSDPAPPQDTPPLAAPVIESVFIPTARGVDLAEADPQTKRTTNSPLSATDPPMGRISVEQWIEALTERTGEHPEDTLAQWELRLLQLAVGDDQAARTPPADTTGEYGALLGKLIDTVIATREALLNPVTASDAALETVEALQTTLQEQSDLRIPTVALCTRVQTFGVYEEMAGDAFVANRANRAIVYLEIGNFMSEQTSDGHHRTVLSDDLEVLTPDGRSVWRHEEPSIVDVSRQRRHDFFLAQMITLPGTLGPGEYVLKVSVQDELSGKSNQAIHRFSILSSSVAQASR
ncbi:MAG: hypothetical protein ACYSUQ_04035 [Planctomycetota bacterium]